MRADLLHVVTTIANPVRWRSRIALWRNFAAHMLASGVHLTVAEVAYGERPFECADIPGVTHIGLRSRTVVWCKESALNIAIQRLPPDWRYVAWIDADIMFRSPTWASDTVHALQLHDFVMPWTTCYDLGPQGQHLAVHQSFADIYVAGKPIVQGPLCGGYGYTFAHPGYAMSATRAALEHSGGLIETAALGAADHHMAMALIGRVGDSIHHKVTPAYKAPLYLWQQRVMAHVATNIGVVPGTIEHYWHGDKGKRRYVDRWSVLIDNQFDPTTDLKRNTSGLLELAGNKPGLRRDILAYLSSRDEDANSLG